MRRKRYRSKNKKYRDRTCFPGRNVVPGKTLSSDEINMLEFDYQNLHLATWENHKISWVVSSLFIPIIFTMEGFFIQKYFEDIGETISLQQIFIFIFGAVLIQSLATIWWLVMNIFRTYNKSRCQRLKEIENLLCSRTFPKKDFLFVDHYNFLYNKSKSGCSKTTSLLTFVPLGMTLSMFTSLENTSKKIESLNLWSIMKVYSLVVLIPFSLNLIILIYLLIQITNIDVQISLK